MIELYHNEEIRVWEEADILFPNTRKNMRREFYIDEDEKDNDINDTNDDEKNWHNYVNKSLHKSRFLFEHILCFLRV